MKLRLAALAVALLVPVGAAAVLLGRGDGDGGPRDVRAELGVCAGSPSPRDCYSRALRQLVGPADDPRPVVGAVADAAWAEPRGFLLPNCHGLMHTVGRTYAVAHGVTLATLMDVLPETNDPGCPAGFAHGLISGVAPQLDASKPATAAAICEDAETRYRRYSCVHGFGHAFMRLVNEQLAPALDLCKALGRDAADCAQGAYHDYWFSVGGYDDTRAADPEPVTDPRVLCAAQEEAFVRPCWYRAFLDTRPAGYVAATPDEIERLCAGLAGPERDGCVTAAAVIGPPDPVDQLGICSALPDADAVSCLHGTKVQNLIREPDAAKLDLARHCGLFSGDVRSECYRWLGKVLSVVTDGEFGRSGCPALAPDAVEACRAGAGDLDGPLVTFS